MVNSEAAAEGWTQCHPRAPTGTVSRVVRAKPPIHERQGERGFGPGTRSFHHRGQVGPEPHPAVGPPSRSRGVRPDPRLNDRYDLVAIQRLPSVELDGQAFQ